MSTDLPKPFTSSNSPWRSVLWLVPPQLRELAARFPAASHGLLSLTDQAVVSATSFLSMVIIGRATSPDQLGLYYVMASILVIATCVQDQLIGAPFTIYLTRRQGDELAMYSGSVWAHQVIMSICVSGVLLATIVGFALTGADRFVPALWLLAGAGPFVLLREWIRRYSYAHLQIVSALAVDMSVGVIQLTGLLCLWHWRLLSLSTIFITIGLGCALACGGWFLFDKPNIRFARSRLKSDWLENWSFGRWALQSYVVGNMTPYIMSWILGLTVSAAAAGVLGACVTLVNIANLFLLSVDRVLMPRTAQAFARGGCDALGRELKFAAGFVLPAVAALCLIVFVMGSRIAVFVFGDQYGGQGPVLSMLALVTFMNSVGMIVGTGLWAIDRPRINFLADLATLVVTTVAAFMLIGPYGVFGAALATFLGASTGSIVRTLILIHALKLRPAPAGIELLQE